MKIPPLCANCPYRETCTELCDEANKYLPPVINDRIGRDDPPDWLIFKKSTKINITPSTSELILAKFFREHKKVTQIAEDIGVSQPYVSKVVSKYKRILRKNLKKEVINQHIARGQIESHTRD